MKVLVAGLLGCAVVGVAFSLPARPAASVPPPRMNALQLCLSGGIELVDERCTRGGACAKQTVRLAWSRGEGTLYEGDSSGERAMRAVGGAELTRLVTGLTLLDPLATDADRECGSWRRSGDCAEAERAMTITTECSGRASTWTFLGAHPVWERVRDAPSVCPGGWGEGSVECLAANVWRTTFATHLANRFGTAFHRLRDAGRRETAVR